MLHVIKVSVLSKIAIMSYSFLNKRSVYPFHVNISSTVDIGDVQGRVVVSGSPHLGVRGTVPIKGVHDTYNQTKASLISR